MAFLLKCYESVNFLGNVQYCNVLIDFTELYNTVYCLKQVNTESNLGGENQLIVFLLFIIEKIELAPEQFFETNCIRGPRYPCIAPILERNILF